MDAQKWYKNLVDKIKDTFEYRFESFILDITEDICRIMKEKKISRSRLAEKLNISKPAVTRMLGGNPNFTLKRLLGVADALDLDLVVDFKDRYRYRYKYKPESCDNTTVLRDIGMDYFESKHFEPDRLSTLDVKPKKTVGFEEAA